VHNIAHRPQFRTRKGRFHLWSIGDKMGAKSTTSTFASEPSLNRFTLAFRSFWKSLTDAETAPRIEAALEPPKTGPDLRILALLQRDGRLIDFLQEDVDAYTDAQIGAATRDIHKGCRKVLREYLALVPVVAKEEGDRVDIEPGFDPSAIRLTGNVTGTGPFKGTLKHHGWKAKTTQLPNLPGLKTEGGILAPAEVEVA
jgi:Domain of unknown function (DUF2760)